MIFSRHDPISSFIYFYIKRCLCLSSSKDLLMIIWILVNYWPNCYGVGTISSRLIPFSSCFGWPSSWASSVILYAGLPERFERVQRRASLWWEDREDWFVNRISRPWQKIREWKGKSSRKAGIWRVAHATWDRDITSSDARLTSSYRIKFRQESPGLMAGVS